MKMIHESRAIWVMYESDLAAYTKLPIWPNGLGKEVKLGAATFRSKL